MNIYYFLLHVLILISALLLLRHSLVRFRYFLQMFQQLGYKGKEFRAWLVRSFYSKVILPEHFLFVVVVFSLLVLLSERLTLTAATLILSIFVIFWFGSLFRYRSNQDKKPLVFTARMKRLSGLQGVVFLFLLYMIADLSLTGRFLNSPIVIRDTGLSLLDVEPYFLLFGMVVLDLSIPFLLLGAAWILNPVERQIQEGFKRKARQKLAGIQDLKVIAITGSYGKTSTKFLIRDLLKERYNVCATPGSFNTPMGICKVINNQLDARHQVLVLEMGARYKGDIEELCRIARPDISVITNVGTAHLETFGSREAIAEEKSTLARELKPGGLLVLNGDDDAVQAMKSLNPNVSCTLTGLQHGTVRAANIRYDRTGTRFTLLFEQAEEVWIEQPIEMKLLGMHNVRNFLLAAAVADYLGLRPATMAVAASEIEPVEHRLEIKQRGGVTIIDDAFNSNPVGARHAVEILSSFKHGRRILVTPGMIELGELQEEANRTFGRDIATANLDLVLLVGQKQTAPILEGILETSGPDRDSIQVVDSLNEANETLQKYLREGDVVLYENDLPDIYS